MNKIISIVIPTLNRRDYLLFTVEHFIPQIERNLDKVELIVCNNASDDDTDLHMVQLVKKYPFINYYYYKERVELGRSFRRSIDNASGMYGIFWGDDDIPAPFFIEILLSVINQYPKTGLIHFNRLIGYENGNPIKSISLHNNLYNKEIKVYSEISNFIVDNFLGATFMSSNLFLISSWKKGLLYNTDSHYGYEFMARIYYGVNGLTSLYISYPLCIQRKVANRSWSDKWAQYALLGIPNMIKDLESSEIFKDGMDVWNNKYNSFISFCYTLISATQNRKIYKPLCKDINKYQKNKFRKFITYFIIYCVPRFVYDWSRIFLFNIKR